MNDTPADFLAHGLNLPPLSMPPMAVPAGTCCAITGQPIAAGYRVADMVTDATAEFLDCFRGGVHGWVSEAAGRCFKNTDPHHGNPTARAVLTFEDGTYFNPFISLDSATKQGRPCWSQLVREVWPARAGQRMLMILTTDMKKRLWIRARVGALGDRTPVLYYDGDTAGNEVLLVHWRHMLECLALIEEVYALGFPKPAIRESLYGVTKAIAQIGWQQTHRYERALAPWRPTPEFTVACLIAQKPLVQEVKEEEEDHVGQREYSLGSITQVGMF